MDAKVKHTPGPWRIVNTNRGLLIAGAMPGYFAEVFSGNKTTMSHIPEQEANARLIAEAPALLDALRYLLQQTIEQDERYSIDLTEGEQDAAERARAILARIDGEA